MITVDPVTGIKDVSRATREELYDPETWKQVQSCESWGGQWKPSWFSSNSCFRPWKKWLLYGGAALVGVVVIVALTKRK